MLPILFFLKKKSTKRKSPPQQNAGGTLLPYGKRPCVWCVVEAVLVGLKSQALGFLPKET